MYACGSEKYLDSVASLCDQGTVPNFSAGRCESGRAMRGSSSPLSSWNSSRVIINAAKLAVYIARKTTANMAHMLVMKRAVKPRGESTCTDAWSHCMIIIVSVVSIHTIIYNHFFDFLKCKLIVFKTIAVLRFYM